MKNFFINGKKIDNGFRPYIIAEMSGNHNQSFEHGLNIIESASKINASAVKLQTYTAETLTIDSDKKDFIIDDHKLWKNYNLFQLYKKAYTNWDWIKEYIIYAKKLNIDCFSSVFDESSIDFMESLDVSAYKIASFENNHIPLIKMAARTKKPLIISTGLASEEEIDEAVAVARENNCGQLALLKCTSDYPADPKDSNLLSIPYLKQKYGCQVGLSDHTLGIGASLASIALGGTIIEKHFTTTRTIETVDSKFSADSNEFALLIKEANLIAKSLGKITFGYSLNEKKSIKFRRSIYAIENIKKGDLFSKKNIRIIRPGYGVHPRYFEKLIGKKSPKEFLYGDRLDNSVLNIL